MSASTEALDVVVVGGGVAGLACAHALSRAGRRVHLLEASPRVGGVLCTEESRGFCFESGPNTVPASAAALAGLVEELGLGDQLVVSRDEARMRYLFHKGRLHPVPTSPAGLARSGLLSLGAKLALATEPLRRMRAAAAAESDEPTLAAFLEGRIGREATRTLGGAFVRGVYASEIDELGADSAFPGLTTRAHESGGLFRYMARKKREAPPRGAGGAGPGQLVSFRAGFETLARALAAALGSSVTLGARASELAPGPGGYRVGFGADSLTARRVVLALPAPASHALLAPHLPAPVAAHLAGVTHASLSVVHLGLEGSVLPPGFGFLVPPDAARHGPAPRALGVLFPSNLFEGRAPAGASAATCIYRRADLHAPGAPERDPVEVARADLALALCVPPPRVLTSVVHDWEEVIPRYSVGHRARVAAVRHTLQHELPGVLLAGAAYDGVSVDDCIASGLRAAAALDGETER